jgi:hypothetical protein
LEQLAVSAGIPLEKAQEAESWQEVADMILAALGGEDKTPTNATEKVAPVKGDSFNYRPLNPKTKKPAKVPVECIVTAVDSSKKTVALRDMTNPKIVYKDVSWDVLEETTQTD